MLVDKSAQYPSPHKNPYGLDYKDIYLTVLFSNNKLIHIHSESMSRTLNVHFEIYNHKGNHGVPLY